MVRFPESETVVPDFGMNVLPSGQCFLPVSQIGALNVQLLNIQLDSCCAFIQSFYFCAEMHLS